MAMKCHSCLREISLNHFSLLNELKFGRQYAQFGKSANRITQCPECTKSLYNCAVCLLPISIANPYASEKAKGKKGPNFIDEVPIEEAVIWCQSCHHGGHFHHISEWFEQFDMLSLIHI
eukprot:TRINITY_DN36738_c0_g1_i1.p2 TRINITY_DN36738_c0_g1~~TRINITY_DN36738_c0_g1_i1.p2  ORF type:complete len:119 (-),score=23.58 TRINITY_DN36738_c0_g1_i1:81-437(-)